MQTLERAQKILTATPREAMREALWMAGLMGVLFAGFLVPAMI